jgi:hypothetical protein
MWHPGDPRESVSPLCAGRAASAVGLASCKAAGGCLEALKGNQAHGRMGRVNRWQRRRTVRTRRWSKALKLATPLRLW